MYWINIHIDPLIFGEKRQIKGWGRGSLKWSTYIINIQIKDLLIKHKLGFLTK